MMVKQLFEKHAVEKKYFINKLKFSIETLPENLRDPYFHWDRDRLYGWLQQWHNF